MQLAAVFPPIYDSEMNGHDISAAHSFSRSAVHLCMSFNETELATGSGVIVPSEHGTRYLVTAWHNLSGRDPESNAPLSRTGGVPNRVRVKGSHVEFVASLYTGDNDPNSNRPMFPTHTAGSSLDVTVLQLPSGIAPPWTLDNSFLRSFMNNQLPLRIGQTCYIIGFPEGLIHQPFENATLPIWKTGHIASEPLFEFQGLPRLVVDATTRPGMSGSMVFVSQPPRSRFVGIYTGRYRPPRRDDRHESGDFTAELGWVFWARVINELIELAP